MSLSYPEEKKEKKNGTAWLAQGELGTLIYFQYISKKMHNK